MKCTELYIKKIDSSIITKTLENEEEMSAIKSKTFIKIVRNRINRFVFKFINPLQVNLHVHVKYVHNYTLIVYKIHEY